MFCSAVRHIVNAISQLPGDEQAALTANLHAVEALVEARNQATHALRKRHWLRRPELGFAVSAKHWLIVLVHHRWPGAVIRGVELDAIGHAPAGVLHLVRLARLGVFAGAYLDVLIAQSKGGLDDSPRPGNARGQLDERRGG